MLEAYQQPQECNSDTAPIRIAAISSPFESADRKPARGIVLGVPRLIHNTLPTYLQDMLKACGDNAYKKTGLSTTVTGVETAVGTKKESIDAVQPSSGVDCDQPVIFGSDPDGNPIVQSSAAFVGCDNQGSNPENEPMPVRVPLKTDPTEA